MNTHRKSSATLAAVIAMILAVPGAAWAGEGGDDDHDRGHGWSKGGDDDHDHGWNRGGYRSNEHYNFHYNNYYGHYAGRGSSYPHYAGREPYYPHYYPHYYPQYYPASPCTNCGGHNHNNHDHDNNELWMGLLGGGILGYGLGTYLHSNTADQGNTPTTAISAPPPPPQYATTAPVSPCLQQREYNTKIMVGGKQVNGYGTACLQPDGSWRYGAAQPESY